jgi:hypothetical protein
MNENTSKLVRDLNHVPGIIAGFGLSIAAAQRALNLDYLEGVERIVALAARVCGEAQPAGFENLVRHLIQAAAPSRYQFSETTLTVRLDLAQSMNISGEGSLGLGWGAAVVNAAFAAAYGYDYRAAAECRCVLHAVPPDPNMFQALLHRARELGERTVTLPDSAESAILEKLLGAPAPEAKQK